MNMFQFFAPGDVIYGFCNGAFGRDDYNTKTCVLVTRKYALFENEEGFATVLHCSEQLSAEQVAKWKSPISEY